MGLYELVFFLAVVAIVAGVAGVAIVCIVVRQIALEYFGLIERGQVILSPKPTCHWLVLSLSRRLTGTKGFSP